MRVVAVLALLALTARASNNYMTAPAVAAARATLQAAAASADEHNSIRIASALSVLGARASPLCPACQQRLSSPSGLSLHSAHSSLRTALLAKCAAGQLEGVRDAVLAGAAAASTLGELRDAAGALDALRALGAFAVDNVTGAVVDGAAARLLALQEADGTYRASARDLEGTFAGTAAALRALAWLRDLGGPGTNWTAVERDALWAAAQLLETARTQGDRVWFPGTAEATADALLAVVAWGAREAVGRLAGVARHLVSLRAGSAEEEAARIEGLGVLSDNALGMPVAVEDIWATASYDDGSRARVRIVDSLGRAAQDFASTVSVSGALPSEVLVWDRQSVFAYDILKSKPAPGRYEMAVKVEPKEGYGTAYIGTVDTVVFHVFGSIEVGEVVMQLSEPAPEQTSVFRTTYPNAVEGIPRGLGLDMRVSFTFAVVERNSRQPLDVAQAIVRFSSPISERTVSAVRKEGYYTAEIGIGVLARSMGVQGDVNVTIAVGDTHARGVHIWKAATLNIADNPHGSARHDVRSEFYSAKP
eukprot:m51a1_g76 hypothetical protein (533) ;mRNA; r:240971-242790